jgi:hypothetical protein
MAGAMGSKRRRKGGRRCIQLWSNMKRSQAFHDCSVYARCALFELLDRYTGLNNGMIALSVRELADDLKCDKDTAARALLNSMTTAWRIRSRRGRGEASARSSGG